MEIKNIATKIAELSLNQFDSLPKTGKPSEKEWTVLTTIVKEQNTSFEVICLGTGSKCIGKSKMCPNGTIINDSHAEIMCRRSFLRYLYTQLTNDSLVFNFDKEKLKFILKPNVKFHFFTTHVPCGDAAIYPKNLSDDVGNILEFELIDTFINIPAKRQKLDTFRTGAKCLINDGIQDSKEEGLAYHTVGVVRTKPGRGDPTASVSCSDKLAKWCHLGIQGSLLMNFLEKPIYLSSFTILSETPFSKEALERALFKRLEDVHLLEPYGRNMLEVHIADLPFKYTKKNDKLPCSSSIAWFKDFDKRYLEIAVNGRKQGVTKKHYSTEKGRLKICKLELFNLFLLKMKNFNIVVGQNIEELNYATAKNLNKTYQQNWEILKKGFGGWTRKDTKLLEFFVS